MEKLIERTIFQEIKQHLTDKEITVIIGARQVGKTTLLLHLKDYLISQKKISSERIFYFNLDRLKDLAFFSEQEEVIKFLETRKNFGTIFLLVDEAQRIPNAGRFFKGIYDLDLPVKIVLTGSSSLELKAKFQEPLTGRKRIFYLWPLSLMEVIKWKEPGLKEIIEKTKTISQYDLEKIQKIEEELVIFGGYPRIVIEKNEQKKIKFLEEIYNSYLEKDIINFLKIKKPLIFNKLVSYLANQICQLVNLDELSNSIGVERKTIEHYLNILEQTFIIKLLSPYFKNPRKELVKMPKVFFIDNGLRNFALGNFNSFKERLDKGAVLENFVANELLKKIFPPHSLHYWRTLHKAEVDFIIRYGDGRVVPIEVKATMLKKKKISRSYGYFIKEYQPRKGYLVNLSLKGEEKMGRTKISFIYPYELIMSV
ncbi:hypothetical protein AMJ49_07035 [Parcubacteria bacterium DG_74_2]|nr:MAG: hypothetical protein AMJ49_07035 [Parcubacteria bacterium DG_74_2]